jgi:hypothetical protein
LQPLITASPLILFSLIVIIVYAINATNIEKMSRDSEYIKLSDAYFRRMFVPICITFCIFYFVIAIIFETPGTSNSGNVWGAFSSATGIKF